MLTKTDRSSTPIVALVVALVILAIIGLAIRSNGPESATSSGSAALTIGGTTYQFTTTACTVTATDFLAAGSGRIDGEDFWISVSPEVAELALGTADESTRSDDGDDLWLMSVGPLEWSATDGEVEAVLSMGNERTPDAPPVRGRFRAVCSG